MNFLVFLLLLVSLNLFSGSKPEKLPLREGPVKEVIKRHYRVHLVRNFKEEADRELKTRLNESRRNRK